MAIADFTIEQGLGQIGANVRLTPLGTLKSAVVPGLTDFSTASFSVLTTDPTPFPGDVVGTFTNPNSFIESQWLNTGVGAGRSWTNFASFDIGFRDLVTSLQASSSTALSARVTNNSGSSRTARYTNCSGAEVTDGYTGFQAKTFPISIGNPLLDSNYFVQYFAYDSQAKILTVSRTSLDGTSVLSDAYDLSGMGGIVLRDFLNNLEYSGVDDFTTPAIVVNMQYTTDTVATVDKILAYATFPFTFSLSACGRNFSNTGAFASNGAVGVELVSVTPAYTLLVSRDATDFLPGSLIPVVVRSDNFESAIRQNLEIAYTALKTKFPISGYCTLLGDLDFQGDFTIKGVVPSGSGSAISAQPNVYP